MIKVLIGILLIIGGMMSFASDIGIIWTGGFIVGASLVVSGLKDVEHNGNVKSEVKRLEKNWDDLLSRIEKDQSIDEIASIYHREHDIPPLRTIIVAAYLIKSLAESGNNEAMLLAAYISTKQIVDSKISPEATINTFSFIREVYFVEDDVNYYCPAKEDEKSPQTIQGTLVLSKGYLFFFPNQATFGTDEFMDAFDNARGLHPVLAIVSDGYSLMSGIAKELDDYFSPAKISSFRKRFSDENSFAVPLVNIQELGVVENKRLLLKNSLLSIRTIAGEDGIEKQYTISNSASSRSWVTQWKERIQLACIVESNLLLQIPQQIDDEDVKDNNPAQEPLK